MKFCGEIIYDRGLDENGNKVKGFWVHSDICHNCDPKSDSDKEISNEFREMLHAALDEYLDNANGTGAFWIGDSQYFLDWERD